MPYELPDEIDPPQISVCVPVPDDVMHRRAFHAQIHALSYYWMWDKDPTGVMARDLATVWRGISAVVAERLDLNEQCGDAGMDCCDEILTAIARLETGTATLQNTLRLQQYNGSPTSINTSSPEYHFNQGASGDTSDLDDRNTALCLAVRQYVYNRCKAALYALAAASGIPIGAGVSLVILGGPLAWIVGAIAAVVGLIALEALYAAADDQDALDNVVCQLYTALQGVPVSQANFAAAVSGLSSQDANEITLIACMQWNTSQLENYLYFLDLLGHGFDQAEAGAVNDCCEVNLCSHLYDFVDVGLEGWYLVHGERIPSVGIEPTYDGTFSNVDMRIDFPDGCEDPLYTFKYHAYVNFGGPNQAIERREENGTYTGIHTFGGTEGVDHEITLSTGVGTSGPFYGFRVTSNVSGDQDILAVQSMEFHE